MRSFKIQPIRRQVVLAAMCLLLPLVAAVIWSGDRTVQEREAELREQAGSVAITSAAYLTQYLDGLDSLALVLARHPDVRALRSNECQSLFAEVLKKQPLLLNVILTSPDGWLRGSGVALSEAAGDLHGTGYVADVVKARHSVVSDLILSERSRKPAIVLAYPVLNDSETLIGVLGIEINLQRLQTIFASIPLPERSVITLSDRASRVLARSLEPERFIGTIISPSAVDPSKAPRTVVVASIDGVSRVYGNAVVERGPWLLSVGIPQRVAMSRVLALWWRNFLIATFGILGTLTMALWLAQKLTQQLTRLRSAAQRIAAGDLTPPQRAGAPNLELAELQEAFITMAINLRETRDALDRQLEQERKMHEALQSLQRQVVRQERLAAVGLLVSGVAHELNNPLQAILGTAELLEHQTDISAEALDEVVFVKTQAGRAREIIRNLSRFSSQQSGLPALIDLRDVISEVVQLRRRDLDSAAVALDVQPASTRPVYANFTELEQVTLNFVINAQQSIESSSRPKGRVLIRLYDVGRKVRLEVLDDGPGVAPEDEPKLFQPFFTTKPVGKGTGLGLSVSYGIIDSYGGSIGYRRNEWGGATFFFELPAADPSAGRPASPSADSTAESSIKSTYDRSAVLHGSILPGV